MFKVVSKSNKKVKLKYFREIGDGEGRVFDQFFSEFDGKYDEIDILFHCYGGIVFEGNLIYNILTNAKSIVNIDIIGVAASMGAVLLKAVRGRKANPKGKVRIARNGFVMIHRVMGGVVGNADDMDQAGKLMRDMEKTFTEDLSDSTGMSEDEVYDKWFKDGADHWLNADECLQYNIVDEIIDPIVKDIKQIDTAMAAQLGAKAMFGKYTAFLGDQEAENNSLNINNSNMKKEDFIARYNLKDVTSESSDSAIYAAFDKILQAEKDRADKAENDLNALKDKEITDAVEAAAKDGRIVAVEGKTIENQKETYVSIGKNAGIEALKTALAALKPHKTIISHLRSGGQSSTGDESNTNRDAWDWDTWQKEASAELEKMPESDWDKFNNLYKAKFGNDAPKN